MKLSTIVRRFFLPLLGGDPRVKGSWLEVSLSLQSWAKLVFSGAALSATTKTVTFQKIKMICQVYRAGETAQWLKCLRGKHEDPGSIPRAQVKFRCYSMFLLSWNWRGEEKRSLGLVASQL